RGARPRARRAGRETRAAGGGAGRAAPARGRLSLRGGRAQRREQRGLPRAGGRARRFARAPAPPRAGGRAVMTPRRSGVGSGLRFAAGVAAAAVVSVVALEPWVGAWRARALFALVLLPFAGVRLARSLGAAARAAVALS